MFFVYKGYVSPDNSNPSHDPAYTLAEYETTEEVLKAKQDFEASLNEECQHVLFRVIDGVEKKWGIYEY